MFAFGNETWDQLRAEEAEQRTDLTLAELTNGIVVGTKVATIQGWRAIEAINAGDMVLTCDGGMQAVLSVRRDVIWTDGAAEDAANWPLHVPAGALGNREDMSLLPQQAVLIESDTAKAVFGDPFAMIPAAALEGFREITRMAPADRITIVSLEFAQDETVFANFGASFFCPQTTDAVATRTPLPLDQAKIIVHALEFEDDRWDTTPASIAA